MPNLFQSLFTNTKSYVPSTSVTSMQVDLMRGTASVMFSSDDDNAGIYQYKNVSRRAILKFIMDDARSLGKFVNNVLKQERVVCKPHQLTFAHN